MDCIKKMLKHCYLIFHQILLLSLSISCFLLCNSISPAGNTELSCVVISSACDAAPYLLVDGVKLLLQHQSQSLCV